MLLDTHALVWALLEPEALSGPAAAAIDAAAVRCVSAASLYEIVYKARLGKWPQVAAIIGPGLALRLAGEGFEIVSADGPVMLRAGDLDWHHRDPFDRMIVATALIEGMPVISKDETLDGNGATGWRRVW